MKLVVGLGNPTEEYNNTRHNIGYMFLDYVTNGEEFRLNKKFNAMEYITMLGGEKIIFV
ncbi:MAG: aminoacyl-tRNA hydrolase, partial [Bacilli bacterium]|nr:aminoacyl-tRNA hydrolase [Bacilli bacterium]